MSYVLKQTASTLALAAVTLAVAAPACAAAIEKQAAAKNGTTSSVISVSEVTNSQITASPDGKTVLADIQGMIYSMPSAGGKAKRLTDPMQEASHPDWSKSGDLVALQCYAGGTFHIWTMKPDGTGLKQVTFGHGDDREPRISPDGKTIVFTSDRAFKTAPNGASLGSYDIWTVPVQGGDPTQITKSDDDEFGPSWSPDGKEIVFVAGTGISATTIKSINITNGKEVVIRKATGANRFEAPSWSPDGKHLAFVEFEAVDAPYGEHRCHEGDRDGRQRRCRQHQINRRVPISCYLAIADGDALLRQWPHPEGEFGRNGNAHCLHRRHPIPAAWLHAQGPCIRLRAAQAGQGHIRAVALTRRQVCCLYCAEPGFHYADRRDA